MTAFEALAKLDSSNVVEIRGTIQNPRCNPRTVNIIKSRLVKYGLSVYPSFFAKNVTWEVAYICECCSGTGIIQPNIFLATISIEAVTTCPECGGDKMIWSAK